MSIGKNSQAQSEAKHLRVPWPETVRIHGLPRSHAEMLHFVQHDGSPNTHTGMVVYPHTQGRWQPHPPPGILFPVAAASPYWPGKDARP